MAKTKKIDLIEENYVENISIEPLEEVMGDRYATYAKYVIQDRAIPDVRDGLKPVQRRIIFSMYKSGNTFNRPTRKCAHTVGAVMGTFHPHGDTSIYDALARMSQDWKLRYPLINFQGNNGSIDGDSPAAYRYTESRLSELSNELIKEIDKKTVDMQLNFDDTEFEPVVLPARFPNLLVNGTEGIAVALATEIPPHNLNEVIEAIIYRINHKLATVEDLMTFVHGPDFPGGGIVYRSEGLKNIYLTGKGRIEIAARCEIQKHKDIQQIVISEIPYKVVKINLVFEIDKIIHSKAVDGLLEVRDESDWKGIRIVIDVKKESNAEMLLQYLMNKTSLLSSYSANMVAIVDGRPRTLNLLQFVDAYIAHQVDVVTRKSRFDLDKYSDRLHIVEGLILASININEVVDIIRKSKDKADSKVNLIARYGFSNEQAEAIVTMPLYKLSHTDELILEKEKEELTANIEYLRGILEDDKKLNRVICKDLKAIEDKYGDARRTSIETKGEVEEIDKRQLIAKEDVMISLTYDGYVKRSSIKSYKSSGTPYPGIKSGDILVGMGEANTVDYLICFTNQGNYITIPVHKMTENKWKDEGIHLNNFATLNAGEKVIKGLIVNEFRKDIYLGILSRFGQIKRMSLASIDNAKHSRPVRFMKLLTGDEVIGIDVLNGNSDLLVITTNGHANLFNENELTVLGNKAGGVKSIANLGKAKAAALLSFDQDERSKVVIFTNKGHERIMVNTQVLKTQRLGRVTIVMPIFKGDVHQIVAAVKLPKGQDFVDYNLILDENNQPFEFRLEDFYLTEIGKYAKKNISIPGKEQIVAVYDTTMKVINNKTVSRAIIDENADANVENDYSEDDDNETETPVETEENVEEISEESVVEENDENMANTIENEHEIVEDNSPTLEDIAKDVPEEPVMKKPSERKKKEDKSFEQMSIFDDMDD